MAEALAAPRRLGYYPGWRFGIDEEGPIGLRTRFRRALWSSCRRRGTDLAINVRWYEGLNVRLYLGNDLSRCLFVGGSYEPNEFALLAEALEPGMTFVDAGANDGLYSLFAARKVGPGGAVLAFEPSAREFARLRDNLDLNHITNVRPRPIGLAARTGTATLRTAGLEHAGQNTFGEFVYDGVDCVGMVPVPVECLDDVVRREGVRVPDVIKIDVEGAELGVLRGSVEVLESARPLLLLELNDEALRRQDASSAEVLAFLRGLGYAIFPFSAATGRLVPGTNDSELSPNVVAAHPARPWRVVPDGR
ncbi:MAG: methyltransferase FkbM family [Gemmataceae bacterium]|nr:methyltransferase FkbM family [Gemmataceae bacterium]